ncbi:MAG: preprotein translocase subunit SecE [Epsilonproteobacteria bacterium]|nr:MAG: preprotein translocase subunit SecE [Campylobacterota bacterium]RLA66527.1 MAG: preprotein translocase subunit SecE [Campylobacterota bacterium]
MSILKSEDSKKWINALVAMIAVLSGFVSIRFTETMGEWFDLEAKVGNFLAMSQGIGVAVGLLTFFVVYKNKKAMAYLNGVFSELIKVIWPEKDAVVKATIGIIIGVSIFSGLFVLVDFLCQKVLNLIY